MKVLVWLYQLPSLLLIAGVRFYQLFIGPMLLGSAALLGGYYPVASLLLSLAGSIVVIAATNVFLSRRLR